MAQLVDHDKKRCGIAIHERLVAVFCRVTAPTLVGVATDVDGRVAGQLPTTMLGRAVAGGFCFHKAKSLLDASHAMHQRGTPVWERKARWDQLQCPSFS